jgi:lipopolysaccharide export system protein LptC
VLNSSNGNKGRLSQAKVDIRNGNVVSDRPVELEFQQGVLNANKLEIVNSGDEIRFHDGVDMVMKLSDSVAAKPKDAVAPKPKTGRK